MRRGPYPLEAVITLPAGLLFGPDFLGLLKSAEIGGVPVHVVLPNFSFIDDEFTTVLHSRANPKWVDYYAENVDDPRWPFGKVSKWNPQAPNGGIDRFSASRLLVLSKERVTLAEGRMLLCAVDGWVERLKTWVEVFARVDLHRNEISVQQEGRSAYVWLDRGKGKKGKTVNSTKPTLVSISISDPLPLTPRNWGRLLSKASSDEAPPEAHLFLRDARHELNNKRYRRSVLDSATATEVALTKLRDDLLALSNSRVGAYVAGSARQISGLDGILAICWDQTAGSYPARGFGTPERRDPSGEGAESAEG